MRVVILLALALLGGCAQSALESQAALEAAQGDLGKQIQILREWKLADLSAAAARATAGGDRIGALCYTTLARYVASDQTLGQAPAFAGVWDAFEAARLGLRAGAGVTNLAGNPVLEDLQLGCGPLVGDIRLTLIKLGIMGGGAVLK